MATTAGDIILWILGFAYVMIGVTRIMTTPISGGFFLAVGILAFPPTQQELQDALDLKLTPYAVIILVLLAGILLAATNAG